MTTCDDVTDCLAELAAGDPAAIDRCADHLAGCDACRDARHDAERAAAAVVRAGADYAPPGDLVDRVLARLDLTNASAADTLPGIVAPRPSQVVTKVEPVPAPSGVVNHRRMLVVAAASSAALAAGFGIYALSTVRHDTAPAQPIVETPIGALSSIDRAAADRSGGVSIHVGDSWRPLLAGASLPAGAELRTDDRTRATLDLADGTRLVLDHATTVAFAADEPRHVRIAAGRAVADVAHVDNRPAAFATPTATVDVVGTRFVLTAADAVTSVQVVRGAVVLRDTAGHREDVRAGEEGIVDHGALNVAAEPTVASAAAWAELEPDNAGSAAGSNAEPTAGLGSLRAYKPGEQRDRDWNLALAEHGVQVRIVGPVARTEITETFRNDSAETLEGRYQFPLPADAQIDALALDDTHAKGEFIDGAFVDNRRGAKIFQGVVEHAVARPMIQKPQEIIWVPGRWRDPALLEWQRGGRFELRVFPIPAHGARTIKLAYTQVVSPRGAAREYVYPLPHSHDGSTVADHLAVDVEVRGAQAGSVHAATYALQSDPTRPDALTMSAAGFVPRGDLVVDYRPSDADAELRAWTFAGGAAVAPDAKLAGKAGVGIDPAVVAAQRAVAADLRPTAVVAIAPKLPRWREDRPRDYAIVVDTSQSMVGERMTRAKDLVQALIRGIDRRDRVTVLGCDSECRSAGDLRAPSAAVATESAKWLDAEPAAGASDVVASVRGGIDAVARGDGDRDRWVLYIGDGFASTGFRHAGDVDRAIAATAGAVRVTSIGIGADADTAVLAAIARGGGGSLVRYAPGQHAMSAANAALASSFGAALQDPTVELPAGLVDAAPTVLSTIRAGEEVLVAARMTGDVKGDVVLRGKLGGQPFEQRYPLALTASSAAGNGFVPRLWASLAIDELERAGKTDDRAKMVALSQGYGVLSRETSLLVLESQAMFDAYGVDRNRPAVQWSGADPLDEQTASGLVAYHDADSPSGGGGGAAGSAAGPADVGGATAGAFATTSTPPTIAAAKGNAEKHPGADFATARPAPKPSVQPPAATPAPPAPAHVSPNKKQRTISNADKSDPLEAVSPNVDAQGRRMIAMRVVWDRMAQVTPYDGVAPSILKAVADFDDALAKHPDSRERHRDLVQALAYAGDLGHAEQIAQRWLDRDPLDPIGLAYRADLLGRDGHRDLALRTLAGLVDLSPDDVALHDRLAHAYDQVGRRAQACGHRVAVAALQVGDAAAAGAAVRCLRSLGRSGDADLVLAALPDARRATAEKAATVDPVAARIAGDLVVAGRWADADLDISIVTPDGTRISWMGGRPDVTAADVTARDREELAVGSLRRGNYLVEVTRADGSLQPVRGSLDITVLGDRKSVPFEVTGSRTVVARVSLWFEKRLVQTSDFDLVPDR
jgi:hypothetical protein